MRLRALQQSFTMCISRFVVVVVDSVGVLKKCKGEQKKGTKANVTTKKARIPLCHWTIEEALDCSCFESNTLFLFSFLFGVRMRLPNNGTVYVRLNDSQAKKVIAGNSKNLLRIIYKHCVRLQAYYITLFHVLAVPKCLPVATTIDRAQSNHHNTQSMHSHIFMTHSLRLNTFRCVWVLSFRFAYFTSVIFLCYSH